MSLIRTIVLSGDYFLANPQNSKYRRKSSADIDSKTATLGYRYPSSVLLLSGTCCDTLVSLTRDK